MRLHSLLLGHVRNQILEYEKEISDEGARISVVPNINNLALIVFIDNSGSMRGSKIIGVASWISVITNILSQSGEATEVLGFTTRAWKGGQSRELWISDGKPEKPGRLNDIRYIVYKSFDESFQESDTNFGIMLREGLLKENIDGEALLWTHNRLMEHPAQRKVIIVISDGASVDDSTLSVNGAGFLENHLISTINWIKESAHVELYGIGVEHDVSRYYGPGSPIIGGLTIGPDLLKAVSFAATRNWQEAENIRWQAPPKQKFVAEVPFSSKRAKGKKTLKPSIG
jgi:cobaltochelatase CobT